MKETEKCNILPKAMPGRATKSGPQHDCEILVWQALVPRCPCLAGGGRVLELCWVLSGEGSLQGGWASSTLHTCFYMVQTGLGCQVCTEPPHTWAEVAQTNGS